MGNADEYRRFAAECLKVAAVSQDDQTKAILLQMAQVWARLAAERDSANSNMREEPD